MRDEAEAVAAILFGFEVTAKLIDILAKLSPQDRLRAISAAAAHYGEYSVAMAAMEAVKP